MSGSISNLIMLDYLTCITSFNHTYNTIKQEYLFPFCRWRQLYRPYQWQQELNAKSTWVQSSECSYCNIIYQFYEKWGDYLKSMTCFWVNMDYFNEFSS